MGLNRRERLALEGQQMGSAQDRRTEGNEGAFLKEWRRFLGFRSCPYGPLSISQMHPLATGIDFCNEKLKIKIPTPSTKVSPFEFHKSESSDFVEYTSLH